MDSYVGIIRDKEALTQQGIGKLLGCLPEQIYTCLVLTQGSQDTPLGQGVNHGIGEINRALSGNIQGMSPEASEN